MRLTYKHTVYTCFLAYIVQAILNNFAPLLFLTFQKTYGIPLSQITLLVTLNFATQLVVDIFAVGFADRIGYRGCMYIAHGAAALGIAGLVVLPELLPSPFIGLLASVMIYAVGGGLLEVLVSPIVESCPAENKEKAMSMLHSFYCWGHVGVVLLSTAFFALVGIENWKILALIWMLVPLTCLALFTKVPMGTLLAEGEKGMRLRQLLRSKIFWVLLVMMICAGASEQAVSQWSSTLAEKGLGVSKTLGDLLGPMTFALLMGTSRAIYGKFGDRLNLDAFMLGSVVLCLGAYLMIAIIPNPILSLVGCGLCGLSVGILWPGSFSKASAAMPLGGTAMFGLLALAGDLGCSGGPTFAGFMATAFGEDLRKGILCATVFPAVMLLMIPLLKKLKKKQIRGVASPDLGSQ